MLYYLTYSLALLGLSWKPVRFTPGWGIAVHTFDVGAFTLFAAYVERPNGPVLFYFVFILMCGILRWRLAGALWTAVAAISGLGAAYLYGVYGLHLPGFALDSFIRRSVQFAGTAALVGYLGTYSHPLASEVSRVALWPRRLPRTSCTSCPTSSRDRQRCSKFPPWCCMDRAQQHAGQHRVAIGRGSELDSRAGGHVRSACRF